MNAREPCLLCDGAGRLTLLDGFLVDTAIAREFPPRKMPTLQRDR